MKKVNKLKFHIIKQHTKEITAKLTAKVLFLIFNCGMLYTSALWGQINKNKIGLNYLQACLSVLSSKIRFLANNFISSMASKPITIRWIRTFFFSQTENHVSHQITDHFLRTSK